MTDISGHVMGRTREKIALFAKNFQTEPVLSFWMVLDPQAMSANFGSRFVQFGKHFKIQRAGPPDR